MVRKVIILLLFLTILYSCGHINVKNPNVTYLEDGFTRIFKDTLFFKKKIRDVKNVKIPVEIDTNSFYIETHYLFGSKKKKYIQNPEKINVYRFYSTSAFNNFIINDNSKKFISKNFNPKITGHRGIIYFENNKWDLVTLANTNESGELGLNKEQIYSISKDTLKLIRPHIKESSIYVYVRVKIENDTILKFKANW